MRELAKPPINAVRTRAGSAPALEANSSASPTASMVSATMIWLATFVVWPSPLWPTSVMFLSIRLDHRKRPLRPTDHNYEARRLGADLSARHGGVQVVAFRPGTGGGDYR